MSYFRTDDPERDFDRLDMEQARQEARLPLCEKCGRKIHDDFYWEIDDEIYCENCMNDRFRKYTEDYIEI